MEVKIITGTAEEVAKILQATEGNKASITELERYATNQYLKERKGVLGNWMYGKDDKQTTVREMDVSKAADSQGCCSYEDCRIAETIQDFMEDLKNAK